MTGYPTVVFLSPDGEVIERMTGNQGAAKWISAMKRVRRQAEASAFIRWRTDLTQAMTDACTGRKPLLIWFSHVRCGGNLAETLTDAGVAKLSEEFVCIKAEITCSAATIKTCKQFKVDLFPTVVFMTHYGSETARLSGMPQKPAALIEKMKEQIAQDTRGKR